MAKDRVFLFGEKNQSVRMEDIGVQGGSELSIECERCGDSADFSAEELKGVAASGFIVCPQCGAAYEFDGEKFSRLLWKDIGRGLNPKFRRNPSVGASAQLDFEWTVKTVVTWLVGAGGEKRLPLPVTFDVARSETLALVAPLGDAGVLAKVSAGRPAAMLWLTELMAELEPALGEEISYVRFDCALRLFCKLFEPEQIAYREIWGPEDFGATLPKADASSVRPDHLVGASPDFSGKRQESKSPGSAGGRDVN